MKKSALPQCVNYSIVIIGSRAWTKIGRWSKIKGGRRARFCSRASLGVAPEKENYDLTEAVLKTERLASLAPMAGAADSAYRTLCRRFGAAFCTSEMASAKALSLGDKKTPLLLRFKENERPFGAQLFGSEPAAMASAARFICERFSPDFIDINMGCPAHKIVAGGAGSALMKDPALAAEIVRAVREAADAPVTVKMRAGWDCDVAAPFAYAMENAGAKRLTVHGRTRGEMYAPPVRYDAIREAKRAVSIPVVGNGDIASPEDALRMTELTGCDAVAVGRGALGDPTLFERINAALSGQAVPPEPSARERAELLREQAELAVSEKGVYIAMLEIRKHAAWYVKGVRGAPALRKRACGISSLGDLDAFIGEWLALI